MVRMTMLSVGLAAVFLASIWWGSGISPRLSRRVVEVQQPVIDLAEVAPFAWDRVCVLKPYANNDAAQRILGFPWDVEGKTDLHSNEGEVALVFVRGQEVVDYAVHGRGSGDLSALTPACLARSKAKLVRRADANGRVYLIADVPS